MYSVKNKSLRLVIYNSLELHRMMMHIIVNLTVCMHIQAVVHKLWKLQHHLQHAHITTECVPLALFKPDYMYQDIRYRKKTLTQQFHTEVQNNYVCICISSHPLLKCCTFVHIITIVILILHTFIFLVKRHFTTFNIANCMA